MNKLVALSAVLVVSTATLFASTPDQMAPASTAHTPPLHYCDMTFFTPEGLVRHKALVQKIAAAVTESVELENGYLFKFTGQFREAGEWLDGARGCCPTVDYTVTFPPQGGPATLRITGGTGAKEFIREEFSRILH